MKMSDNAERPSLADVPRLPNFEMPAPEAVETDKEGLPVFTGDDFYKTRPRDYEMILALAAEGNTIRSIARVVGASKNTVQAILVRERNSMTMEDFREKSGLRLRNSLAQTIDRIDEALNDDDRMAKTSLRDHAYLMKELAEKMQLFSGGVTHRTSKKEEDEHAGDMDYLRRMQEAEAIDVTPKEQEEREERARIGNGFEGEDPRDNKEEEDDNV